MIRAAVTLFLVVHGLLHLAVWAAPADPGKQPPFDPGRSWVLRAAHVPARRARTASVALACAATVLYVMTGASLAVSADQWTVGALIAAATGLALKVGWFHPWLSVGVLLDAGVVVAVAQSWPGSLY